MSGGAYEYVYHKIQDIEIQHTDKNFRRKAFQALLKHVADCMHDIEWVDSGDYSPGDENETLDGLFLGLETLTKEYKRRICENKSDI